MFLLRWRVVFIGVFFAYFFIQARPYLHGIIGGANKHKLNQQAQKVASNYVYAQELLLAIEIETDSERKSILQKELDHLQR